MSGFEGSTNPQTKAVVGRDAELRAIRSFLRGDGPATCLVFAGEPGIGKTTLWETGIELARDEGYQVLSARGSEAEASLAFAALADLVDGIEASDLLLLPSPQQLALEVTLRRADPVGGPPDPYAISAGFLSAIDVASQHAPVLIAIDDLQWLDGASSGPLLFVARRLPRGAVRFLVTMHSGRASELERSLLTDQVERLEIEALSLGAIGRVLAERQGLTLSRHALRRVHDASQGNPLFALELGRLLGKSGRGPTVGELPLPDLAGDVFNARIDEAGASVRRILLAVALSGGLRPSELSRLVDPLAIEDAVTAGLLIVEATRVRAANPMLAAAARNHANAAERRALHLELATVVGDPILQARHLAIATQGADAEAATAAVGASELAAECGRVFEAVELAEHALRLTSPDDPESSERVLALARLLSTAGQGDRLAELLTTRMNELPPGRSRALAHLLLDEVAAEAHEMHLDHALEEAEGELDIRALAFARRAMHTAIHRVERIDEAESWALRAASAAESADAAAQAHAATALAWSHILRGCPVVSTEGLHASSPPRIKDSRIARPTGVRHAFRGELERARDIFEQLLAEAQDRGELVSVGALELQLCEVALRAGDRIEAERRIADFEEVLLAAVPHAGTRSWFIARVRAVMAAIAGDPAQVVHWAEQVVGDDNAANPLCSRWDQLEAERALGLGALFDHDPERAVHHLSSVWQHTRREHIDDPGAFPAAGDLVEALVECGRLDEATGVLDELRSLSIDQDHPWGLATTKRAEALLRVALEDRFPEEAADAFATAAESFCELGLDFDEARSLLSLGVLQRRFKKRGAARSSLEAAAEIFNGCGSPGWEARALEELHRVSGRRSSAGDELTPTESRVVKLAAAGKANKEIARELFVSVNTVEGHLSRAYAKLGVGSRGQLARKLGELGAQ